MSHERNMKYFNAKRVIYRREPITDIPTKVYDWGNYYENGTHECYELFRSKAKITTYKSLKWHMLVLWYLNPDLTQDNFKIVIEQENTKRSNKQKLNNVINNSNIKLKEELLIIEEDDSAFVLVVGPHRVPPAITRHDATCPPPWRGICGSTLTGCP